MTDLDSQTEWRRATVMISKIALSDCGPTLTKKEGLEELRSLLLSPRALQDFEMAVQAKLVVGYAERAWLRADDDDPQFRDGKQALADAEVACRTRATGRNLEIPAAAQAELGDFRAALQSLAKANIANSNEN